MSARDASGSAPQHSHAQNNTMSRNEKFWVDQVTVPHPPRGNDKGWGTTRGGEGSYESHYIVSTCCIATQTRSVPNVALSALYTMAIECCISCLGQLTPSHRGWLDIILAPRDTIFYPIIHKI